MRLSVGLGGWHCFQALWVEGLVVIVVGTILWRVVAYDWNQVEVATQLAWVTNVASSLVM